MCGSAAVRMHTQSGNLAISVAFRVQQELFGDLFLQAFGPSFVTHPYPHRGGRGIGTNAKRLYLSIFPFSLAIFPFLFFVKCVSCGFSLTTMKLTSDDAKDVECAGLK